MGDEVREPSLAQVQAAREAIADAVIESPVWAAVPGHVLRRSGCGSIAFKLEALQPTGSFKPRAAVLWARALDDRERARGLVAVSAGNHAMAVAYAAARTGTTATVVMPKTADPARIAGAQRLGATIVLTDDVHAAFAEVQRIVADEGRTFVHPFEGEIVARGTGTIALELHRQHPELDAIVVPIGGGGLCAGIAAASKLLRPTCAIYGVEPEGADSMHRSFAAGSPQPIDAVRTIADSLGAPHAAAYSFALCRRFVDDLARVDDDALVAAMAMLHADMGLFVEPAGAAATAAIVGPLRQRLAGKRVAAIVCGKNVQPQRWAAWVQQGAATLTDG